MMPVGNLRTGKMQIIGNPGGVKPLFIIQNPPFTLRGSYLNCLRNEVTKNLPPSVIARSIATKQSPTLSSPPLKKGD